MLYEKGTIMEIQVNIAPSRWGKTQKAISSYKQCYCKKEKCLMILHNYNSKISARNTLIKEGILVSASTIMHQNDLDYLRGMRYGKVIIDDFAYFNQKNKDILLNYLQFSAEKIEIWSNSECKHKKDRLLNYYKTGSHKSEYNNYCKNIFLKHIPNFLDKNLFIV